MSTKYFPNETGSSNVRGILTYTTSQTDTQVTITLSAVLQANGVYGSGYQCLIKVDGTTVKSAQGAKSPPAVAGWTQFLSTGNATIPIDRTTSAQTVNVVASFAGKAVDDWFAGSGSGECTVAITVPALDKPTVTQSLSSKTGTSITMSWSANATCDYVWYSTNGGSSYTAVGSVNAASGSYTIAGLSANTTYSIKTKLRRKDSQQSGESSALSVTTYAAPSASQSVASKTGSSITINWSSNKTIDYVWYSKNGGTSWVSVGSANATSGSYTITGLSANTAYSIKTRLRGKESQTSTDSSATSVTTYAYPTSNQTVSSKTDTTIKINWSSDSTCDYVWYSKNNGSTWVSVGAVTSSSGSYTISGLTADTTYQIKTKVRGKNSQLTTSSSATSVTTYAYPTITQSLSSKTTTSITIAWSSDSTCDYLWYSKNGGSSWVSVGSISAKSGTYTISGLSKETTYQIKTRVRRADSQYTKDSSTLSVTTYGVPTVSQSLSSKTETTIVMAWESANTCDYVWYSLDDGSSWVGVGSANAKSGTYTISGLTANTTYNVKTRLRRKDSQYTAYCSQQAFTTYDYPHATSMPNFTIGNSLKVTIYNPLGRSVAITMIAVDGSTLSAGTITGTTREGFATQTWKDFFYASIPSAKSGTYKIKCTYSGVNRENNGGTYTINSSECAPSIGSLTYQDTNSTTTTVTGNNQKIVQGLSTVRYTASTLSVKNSASISSVKVKVNGTTYNLTVSGSSATGGNATINSGSNVTATATITDSRGLTATKSVTVSMLSWALPSAIITLNRQSNFYATTYLKCDAIYSSVDSKNTITISYTGTAVPRAGKTTPASVSGSLSDNVQVSLTLDNEFDWNFVITLVDKFGTTTYNKTLARGTPIIFFDDRINAVGVGKFPSHNDALEFNSGFLGDSDLSQITFSAKDRNDPRISSAGWYRIIHVIGSDAYTRGNDAYCLDITIGTAYNNERNVFHKISLLAAYNTFAFANETSFAVSSFYNVISKIRYSTDGNGNGYIDVYYNVNVANRVIIDFVRRPYYKLYSAELVDFQGVDGEQLGETVRAEYSFKTNRSTNDVYFQSGDTFSALCGMAGYCDTGSTSISLRYQPPKIISGTPTLTSFTGRIRHVNGGYADGVTGDWMAINGVTVSMTTNDTSNEFVFTLSKSETFKRSSTSTTAITANTPVFATITPSITFA